MAMNIRLAMIALAAAGVVACGQNIQILSIRSLPTEEAGIPIGQNVPAWITCRGIDASRSSFDGTLVGQPTPLTSGNTRIEVSATSLFSPFAKKKGAILAIETLGDSVQMMVQIPQGSATISIVQGDRQGSADFQQASVWDALFVWSDATALAIRIADGSWISDSNPAKPGDTVMVLMSGISVDESKLPTIGFPQGNTPMTSQLGVALGDLEPEVLSKTLVAGLYGIGQFTFRVPGGATSERLRIFEYGFSNIGLFPQKFYAYSKEARLPIKH